ncbi:MAG: nicotinamide-nucleotide amidohydrolase family protein, partial [Lachnospiraceae bacterium]|nr:nicotinamide-nucleotide amidohydrolase family protein [Lachnospiraceae bacterium]
KQTNPTIATYAKTGEVHLRITAKAKDEDEARKLIKPVVKEVRERFGNNIYSTKEDETLEEAIVKLLKKHDLSLTTAESCTGGLLSGRLVNVPGVSEVFKQGFITYSDKAKRKLLDVSKSTLKKYGAVSEETVKEMAKGGVFATDSDICVAISGIAGPEGGSEEKPVGTVYIGCYINDKIKVEKYYFKGNRAKIRDYSVVRALDLLRRCILENYGDK